MTTTALLFVFMLNQTPPGAWTGPLPSHAHKSNPRDPLQAESLEDLLRQIKEKTGLDDLDEALRYDDLQKNYEYPQGLSPQQIEWLDHKLKALDALHKHGNRLVLPIVARNMNIGREEINEKCFRILMDFKDIHPPDIRAILGPRLERLGRVDFGPIVWAKGADIHNMPLIIRAIKLERHPAKRNNLLVDLRNIIFIEYPSKGPGIAFEDGVPCRKARFFPYKFDDYLHLTDEDLDKILEIYEKNKKRIPNADPPNPQRSPVT